MTDGVTMPPRNLFVSAEEYSATLLHELTHYADFRIMPGSSQGSLWLTGREREMSA
jgi:antirestriction protein ArdC